MRWWLASHDVVDEQRWSQRPIDRKFAPNQHCMILLREVCLHIFNDISECSVEGSARICRHSLSRSHLSRSHLLRRARRRGLPHTGDARGINPELLEKFCLVQWINSVRAASAEPDADPFSSTVTAVVVTTVPAQFAAIGRFVRAQYVRSGKTTKVSAPVADP